MEMKRKLLNFSYIIAALFLTGCASTPQFYPNAKYKAMGEAGAEKDVQQCTQDADTYLKSSEAKKILGQAGKGSIVGGVVGAVAGAFSGSVGQSAVIGASVGGAAGGASAAVSPDELKRSFIEKCLQDKGYDVIGWG
ncbi:cell envelope biogenesis protein OmpA [Thiotrichales bacterium 19S9-12]|nr:cell envelope biogenesis protein OmpA [Thiotrichales bacterium 19S9-12]